MGQITGGHLFFLKRVKTGDYEHEEAQAHINFSVGEGEDESGTLARAHTIALEQVRAMLRLQDASKQTTAPVVQTAASGTGDKAKLAAAAGAPAAEAPKAAKQPPKAKKEEPKLAEQSAPAAEAPKAAEVDGIDDLLDASAPEITDKQLVEHVTATNQRIKNPAAIKATTAKYVGGPPKTVRDIPQELRQKFMAELDTLQAAAA